MSSTWWANGLAAHEPADRRPDWAAFAEGPFDVSPRPVPADWRAAFASVFGPLIDAARRPIEAADVAGVDLEAVSRCLAEQLSLRVCSLAARTLVFELNKARARGKLTGETAEDRFRDFVRQAGENLPQLFTAYPVLGRLVSQACLHASEAYLELLKRFADDREALEGTVVDELGTLIKVSGGGDPHQRGRTVKLLEFSSGQQVIYKPRPLELHTRFAEVVRWLNKRIPGLELEAVDALVRPGYGWLRFVEHQPCADLTEVDRFYRREGILLALLYAVDGADVHFENLIARASQPVLIDIETLFHPALPVTGEATDPAAGAVSRSVLRTCLLPQMFVGEHGAVDISGLGGGKGGTFPTDHVEWLDAGTDRMRITRAPGEFGASLNRPTLDDRDIEPGEHGAALLAGFRIGYDAIESGAAELRELLDQCADDVIRVLARPTNFYARLLDETTHPDLLRDAAARDRAFALVWDDSVGDATRKRLAPSEIADLWDGDVPMFTAKPGARHLWDSAERRLDDVLADAPLTVVGRKLASLNTVDRRDQEWLISAALATRPTGIVHHSTETMPETGLTASPEPGRLLAAACGVADQIVARAFSDEHRTNWLGLELVDELYWTVLPMGASLGEGYTGVALFLAQLAELTGLGTYHELAFRALSPIPGLLDKLEADPELAEAAGCGGLLGLGGVAYALARLAKLLDDPSLLKLTERAVAVMPAARADLPPQFTTGLAGGIAAMSAVHSYAGLDAAGSLASEYAAALKQAETVENTGFARGSAGIQWALGASFTTGVAGDRAHSVTGHGWCSGLAGLALADSGDFVPVLAEQAPLRDLSLCHGEFGIVDVLSVLAERGHPAAAAAVNRRAGRLVSAIEQHGARCGTPGAVSSPGLLTGLAGIGYGLLRLGFADRVPSVLTLH
ncbi:type 2 lantibiotic biosynthesis protein LanM [Amycolatopsis xylanica]|uniref:Type 2 lantibiotic biosynthesis protein LanM n=1 Tax=Amycolatopsis xylanica TaxID=589385 RepID=A0A1H3DB20_9PSEU|nr:type 2 lanthipeptide synthetase LanM family protein [Amycolatopsis xylanica]SDX63338.1 type 2 lantibiotic biosynthesis protein LanM [Amycolatopsis xylanica]